MRRHLKHFAKNDLFGNGNLPVKSNKRYFPRPKTIRNHIVRATRKLRRSLIDQECLVDKIEQWKQDQKETNIYFRPKKKAESNEEMYELPDCDEDGRYPVAVYEEYLYPYNAYVAFCSLCVLELLF